MKKNSLKITLISVFLIFVFIVVGIKITQKKEGNEDKKDNSILKEEFNVVESDLQNNIIEAEKAADDKKDEKIQSNTEKEIPEKFFIEVPFTSQAPFAVWDEFHEEACEEASLIMLKYFFSGKKLTKEVAEREIQDLIEFQNKKYGDYKDTTAQETADLFVEFYGEIGDRKKLKVIYDFEKSDLKKYLSQGFPIIIPAAGRELGNPYFTSPGPLYHNLVLVGYNQDIIITNDPGTKRGEGYKYDMDVIYNAIHDFPGKPENIIQGRKAMIAVVDK